MAAMTAPMKMDVSVTNEKTFSSHVRGCGKRNSPMNSSSGAALLKNDGFRLFDIIGEKIPSPFKCFSTIS